VPLHVGVEDAAGGRERVREHVHLHRRGHPDHAGEPRGNERGVHVPHGREDEPHISRAHLVAHGDVLDEHVRVVGLDPDGRGGGAAGEVADRVDATHVQDEADAAAAERGEGAVVRGVDAHGVDVVGLVELHHVRVRRQVVAEPAVADTVHACS
jgi:hypothetical protein